MSKTKHHNYTPEYWVACSGGVDSMVATRLLFELGKKVGVLHCNFQLRGKDSENDEKFVTELSESLNIPILKQQFDVATYLKENGGNTQLAARKLRYNWFEEIKNKTNAIIVLGHHQDDQIETFLLQLQRGGRVDGLASMAVFQNNYFRPLLNYRKDEIYALALNNKWKWREDTSNQEDKYKRNLYRNKLIPLLKIQNLDFQNILILIDDFQLLANYLKNLDWKLPKVDSFHKVTFDLWLKLSLWLKYDLLKKLNLTDFSVKELDKLSKSIKGTNIESNNFTIWNEGCHFIVTPKDIYSDSFELKVEEVNKSEIEFGDEAIYLDKDKVVGNLGMRKWRAADKFQPLGMKGRKLVSDFLIDKKIPAFRKKNIRVLTCNNGVIGVFGYMPDQKVKVTEQTTKVYRVSKVVV
ncbi:MAG: tRNA lysidine(34) synthetase TilS [Brumimicrobium sp.]